MHPFARLQALPSWPTASVARRDCCPTPGNPGGTAVLLTTTRACTVPMDGHVVFAATVAMTH